MSGIGVYVHVPFCRRKCRYCDFYSRPPGEGELDRFTHAVVREANLRAEGIHHAATVYFGGGTPSILGSERLGRVLSALRSIPGVNPGAELTVEANPLDVTTGWARDALAAGFNRISVGVQSINDEDLRFLGRLHGAGDGPRAAAVARDAGFTEVGIDLIYGLPGQTSAVLRDRLIRAVRDCQPTHVSCYQLTYAEGTPLWDDVRAGRSVRLSDEDEYELFVCVHATMAELGYPAYEVSNFSLNDEHRSLHNSNYWRHVPYVGLGPSAHSFLPPIRSWNMRSVTGYLTRMESGALPTDGAEELSAGQLAAEAVMLALRTTDGLDLALYRERFGRDLLEANRSAVQRAAERGLVVPSGERLRPTLKGLAVADALAAEFA